MRRIRILLADDMAVIRQGLRAMLERAEDLRVVAEAADGPEAVRLARATRPDAALLDEDMPGGGGVDAVRALRREFPHIEAIIMAERLDEARVLRAIEAGAMGYVCKDIPAPNLAAAIRAVTSGRVFFHPDVTRQLVDNLGRLIREQQGLPEIASAGLTRRQFDVLVELANGATYGQIADKLLVAEGTVKAHMHNILRKLGCRNRTQLVAYVLRKGLIK
jgi:DNA-binding NarL/FixJ family response regulator